MLNHTHVQEDMILKWPRSNTLSTCQIPYMVSNCQIESWIGIKFPTNRIFWLSNRICICIFYVIWVSGSPFLVKQNQFSFKESYETLTHQKHHTWNSQKEWRRSTCAMTVFVALVLLLFHIVQLYNHEWRDDSHSSSRKWCHNWVNFTVTPHPTISSLGGHTTS